jgi:hypothetical protein
MKKLFTYTVLVSCLILVALFNVSNVSAGAIKQGDNVTIVTPETIARLCPYPNCGQDQHITRIPKGTVLTIEGIQSVKSGRMPAVKWFEVTYNGKKGWISMYDTNKS